MSCDEFHVKRSIVLCNDNVHLEDDIMYMPIYMIMFLQRHRRMEQMIYKVDIRGL